MKYHDTFAAPLSPTLTKGQERFDEAASEETTGDEGKQAKNEEDEKGGSLRSKGSKGSKESKRQEEIKKAHT